MIKSNKHMKNLLAVSVLSYLFMGRSQAASMPADPALVTKAIRLLQSAGADQREKGAEVLGAIARNGEGIRCRVWRAINPLTEALLKDTEPGVRSSAADALGEIGAHVSARKLVLPLVQALQDSSPIVRYRAASAIGAVGPDAEAAVPALLKRLKEEEDNRTRGQVVFDLGWMDVSTQEVADALVGALKDRDKEVQRLAVVSLGHLRPVRRGVVPALIQTLKDPKKEVHSSAFDSLFGIGTREAKAGIQNDRELGFIVSQWQTCYKDSDCTVTKGPCGSWVVYSQLLEKDPLRFFRDPNFQCLRTFPPTTQPATYCRNDLCTTNAQ
jgi:hypothetical protein